MKIRGRKLSIKVLLCVVICLYSFCDMIPMEAQNSAIVMKSAGKTVRVGVNEIEGFMAYDEDGNVTGYGQDYLNAIANVTGWNYEYVKVENFQNGMEKLKNQEIDLMAPCQMDKEDLENYDYSAYSFGTEYITLVTRKENDAYEYEDFESFERMKVALVTGYAMSKYLDYMKENHFSVQFEYYDTPEEALKALDEGKVDGAVTTMMRCGENYKILARFSSYPFYFATWKGNTELLSELDDAMQNIKNAYPNLENDLQETYYPVYGYRFFSAEERAFIASQDTLKVGYIQGRSPLSFRDEETGEFEGISRAIFDKIQEISGLQFEYVPIDTGLIDFSYLKENEIDLITGVEFNAANRNTGGMVMSNAYLTSRKVFVGKKDVDFSKTKNLKLAVSTGSTTFLKMIRQEYPNFEIVEYETVEECFEAVRKGKTDLLLQNQYVVEDWLDRPKYEGLAMVQAEGMEDDLCFSALLFEEENTEENVRIITIINKALSQISQEEMDSMIVTETMQHRYQYTLADFCYRYRFAVGISVVFLVSAFGAVLYILTLKERTNLLQKEEESRLLLQQKRYQLVMDHSDDMIYEISLKEESWISSMRIKEKFGWEIPKKIEALNVENIMKILHVHPEDEPIVKNAFHHVIEEKKSGEKRLRIQTQEGDYIWCEVTCLPFLDEENRLVSIIGKIEDVDHEVREKEKLEIQSRTDGLTGLLNKKTFIEETTHYLEEHSAVATGLIFVDLDHFKDVNDTLGHAMGDYAIQKSGQKLQVIFANYDLVSRFGGDEFCIFVKDIPIETFHDKLGWAVDKLTEVYENTEDHVKVTASIGAVYCQKEKADYPTLFKLADEAVYEAKRKGRNRYILKEEK
ncbi:MAG: diguanylate cyclase domain-containing protein [Roseburia sp.]